MKLTAKQQAFADYYIQTANATEAARLAGYKGNNLNKIASENLTKLDIRSYIDEKMAEINNKRIADATEILEYLTSGMREELTEEVIVTEADTDGGTVARTAIKKIGIKDRNKCAELLGKRYKLFTDKIEADVNATATVIFAGEDELED